MPAKFFIVAAKADKQFLKLPTRIQAKIIQGYSKIKQNPVVGAKLGGELADQYKFRVGDYRIIYQFNTKISRVEVTKVEHRQGVYK